MSLYFNWSCDFQQFTKSKKLSKFQVRTTTLFISNKSLSTSLFNLQGTIRCFKEFSQLFVVLNRSSTAYLVYQNQKRLSRTFFNSFSKNQAVLNQAFRFCACLSETALIEYQIREHLSNTFFVFCKNFAANEKRRLTPSFSLFPDVRTKSDRRAPKPCPAT